MRVARQARPGTWSKPREAVDIVLYGPHLKQTITVAVVVGTILFCINQLDVVLHGEVTATVWFKLALTYLVPFVNSNVGLLIASRRRSGRAATKQSVAEVEPA